MLISWLHRLLPIRPLTAWRPRLAFILFSVNVLVLALPVAGFLLLRVYESSLLRQTESGLITQGVLIAATYEATTRRLAIDEADFKQLIKPVDTLSKSVLPTLTPQLDLASIKLMDSAPLAVPMAVDPPLLAYYAGAVMHPILQKSLEVTGAEIDVVDAAGQVIASTSLDIGVSLRHREELIDALSGRTSAVLRRQPNDKAKIPAWLSFFSRSANLDVHLALPILNDEGLLGAVLLHKTPITLITAFKGKGLQVLVAVVVIMATIVMLSLFTSFTISQPVQSLIAQTRRARRGETGAVQPLPHPVTREIAELSQAMTSMADSLEQRTDYIRSFAAQLSHELKSPLTSMRGAIELMQDHADMPPERQSQFLANLYQDVDRLTRIVGSILELARAEADKGRSTNTASLSDVLTFNLQQYAAIDLVDPEDLSSGRLRVPLSEDDLYAIIKNLVENAFQHGATQLRISLSSDRQPFRLSARPGAHGAKQVTLVFLDNGPGVSLANQPKIFEPFFTTDRPQGGTGLGLSLVKSLLEGIGGQIRYLPDQGGACFELVFPLVASPRGVLKV